MTTKSRYVLAQFLLLAGLGMLSTPATREASAASRYHLRLVKSIPAANDSTTSPAAVRLWFSLKPALSVTSIKLMHGSKEVPLGKVTFAGDVTQPVEAVIASPLPAGTYTVAWKTASTDMHPVSGSFSFTVR
jgi:copper resistance protein C